MSYSSMARFFKNVLIVFCSLTEALAHYVLNNILPYMYLNDDGK